MNLLLIGNFVLDTIDFKGDKFIKPGGIYYSAFGLNLFNRKNVKIKLLTQTDKTSRAYLNKFNKIDSSLIKIVDRIPNVHLTVFEDEEREEKYLNFAGKIDFKTLPEQDSFDGVLINMITGNDISLNDLIELRQQYDPLIYLDIHSLAKELDSQNKMRLRQMPDVEKWLDNIDILQANEIEALSIIGDMEELKIVEFVLLHRTKIFILTKGKNGAAIYYKSGNEIKFLYCKPVIGKTINKVGCGDIFGSVFFYNYLLNKNITKAAELANTIAGLSTKVSSEQDLVNELKRREIL